MAPRPHLQRLVERARLLPALPAAFVFPLDRDALQMALSAAFAGYLAPTLVGPEARVRDAAVRAGLDISRLPLIDTPDDPRAAGERAATLARSGAVGAIVKGSLPVDDLLAPVADPASGLRTNRRLSHAYFLDLRGFPRGLVVADAMLNVAPNLAAKRDIVDNTIRLAVALGIATPAVALLAAKAVVSPSLSSTSEAAALKSMAAQGRFPPAEIDGPLPPDVAISADAAHAHGVRSPIAGRADVLVAPSLEAATMVVRTLTGFTGGLAAGLVVGATVPIVLTTSYDAMDVRMASCVLAALMHAGARPQLAAEASNVVALAPRRVEAA